MMENGSCGSVLSAAVALSESNALNCYVRHLLEQLSSLCCTTKLSHLQPTAIA